MRLRDGVVGGGAGVGVEKGEEGAEDEGGGVDGEEDRLERCREIWAETCSACSHVGGVGRG